MTITSHPVSSIHPFGCAVSVTRIVELNLLTTEDVNQTTMNSSKNSYLSSSDKQSVSVGDNVGNGTHGTNSNTYT